MQLYARNSIGFHPWLVYTVKFWETVVNFATVTDETLVREGFPQSGFSPNSIEDFSGSVCLLLCPFCPYKLKGQCDQISYKEQDYCNMGNTIMLHKDRNIMLVFLSIVKSTIFYK